MEQKLRVEFGIFVFTTVRRRRNDIRVDPRTYLYPDGGSLVIGELRTANWRTGNMRTYSANYGREPRVQCEPESANFFMQLKEAHIRACVYAMHGAIAAVNTAAFTVEK